MKGPDGVNFEGYHHEELYEEVNDFSELWPRSHLCHNIMTFTELLIRFLGKHSSTFTPSGSSKCNVGNHQWYADFTKVVAIQLLLTSLCRQHSKFTPSGPSKSDAGYSRWYGALERSNLKVTKLWPTFHSNHDLGHRSHNDWYYFKEDIAQNASYQDPRKVMMSITNGMRP